MGISSALNIALSGLKANQRQLDTTANNVANASTVGYSRKVIQTGQIVAGDTVSGVRAYAATREINVQVQRQWRNAVAGAEYASVRAETLGRLDLALGGPNNPNALDALFNAFTQKLETLAASPENGTARLEAVATAEQLTGGIRNLSADIQLLRQDAEDGIAVAVTEANELLRRIADLDRQVVATKVVGATTADLEDQRDAAIDRLAELVDIRVADQQNGAIAIYTNSGTLLYDDEPVQMRFDARGNVQPSSAWSVDPAERTLGTIVIDSGPGRGLDLFADDSFRSGHIAALKELRDVSLVDAQAQLDEMAARLSAALSSRAVAGEPTAGPADGYAVDLAGIREGNVVTLDFTSGGTATRISLVATAGTFNGDDRYTADPTDTVVPIDFTGTDAAIQADIQAALGANFTVTYAAGQLTVEDATGGTIDVTGLGARITAGGLQDGTALPLFLDAGSGEPFTGLVAGEDPRTGLAARLIVNPAVKLDPAYMVRFSPTTDASDDRRPRALLEALTQTRFTYDPGTGIGTRTAPYAGTVAQFVKTVVSTQGAAASGAKNLAEGQSIVAANLEIRYEESREVDVDEEMARLIELQTAYQANARVLTVAQQMLDALLKI